MEIGKKIALLREKKKWSQKELAARAGINPSVMNRIESGERPLRADELKTIARLLDVSTDELLDINKKEKLKSNNDSFKVTVAGQEISLTPEEMKLFMELRKHPILFHDLASDPEKKVKELIKLYKMKKILLEEDEEEYGEGFGELDD